MSTPIKGYRQNKDGKLVKVTKAGSVSDQIKRRKSKKVRVVKRGAS